MAIGFGSKYEKIKKEMDRLQLATTGKPLVVDVQLKWVHEQVKDMGFYLLKKDMDRIGKPANEGIIYEAENKVINNRTRVKRTITLSQVFGKKRNQCGFFVTEEEVKGDFKDIIAICIWIEIDKMPFRRYEWIIPVSIYRTDSLLEWLQVDILPMSFIADRTNVDVCSQELTTRIWADQYLKDNKDYPTSNGPFRIYIDPHDKFNGATPPSKSPYNVLEYLKKAQTVINQDESVCQVRYENIIDMGYLDQRYHMGKEGELSWNK